MGKPGRDLRCRTMVDEYGSSIHPCPAAISLSLARHYHADFDATSDRELLRDALDMYDRALRIERACGDCKVEASNGLDELTLLTL